MSIMHDYKKLLALCLLLSIAEPVIAIDLQPGEVAAPRPNFYVAQYSYVYSERGTQYVRGQSLPSNQKIESSSMIVRLARSFELANMPAFFYMQTPISQIKTDGFAKINGLNTQGEDGVGDTSFAFAVWPYSNRETRTYFGVGAYLTVPTGSYDSNSTFNVSENRYRSALQAAYQTQLSESISWMAALDGVFYQDNDEYFPRPTVPLGKKRQLEQNNLYTAQTGLKFDISPQYSLAAAYFYTVGGETQIDGVNQHNLTQLHRYQLSAQGNYSFGRLLFQYGGDLKTENGYIEDKRVILRYTTVF
jgi:hypothetical protein